MCLLSVLVCVCLSVFLSPVSLLVCIDDFYKNHSCTVFYIYIGVATERGRTSRFFLSRMLGRMLRGMTALTVIFFSYPHALSGRSKTETSVFIHTSHFHE